MSLPRRSFLWLAAVAAFVFTGHAQVPTATPTGNSASAGASVDASAPIEKADKTGKFQKNHQSFLKRSKAGPIGLLFLGDSITEGWHYRAQSLFEQTYGAYQPANFGIGGDTTQNVIWRITHGELDGIHPKVVVLMIGTNNTTTHTTAQIAAADTKIVRLIREKIPGVKILLLAILPRGPRPTPAETNKTDNWQHRMEVINAVNLALAALDDGVTVRYLDIGARFLGPDGRIPGTLMSDQLHPTTAGYQIWANAMQPTLLEMLNSR